MSFTFIDEGIGDLGRFIWLRVFLIMSADFKYWIVPVDYLPYWFTAYVENFVWRFRSK